MIGILNIHRDERYWPNPLMFDPDRFLSKKTDYEYFYIPFSKGRRSCIGKHKGNYRATILHIALESRCSHIFDILIRLNISMHVRKILPRGSGGLVGRASVRQAGGPDLISLFCDVFPCSNF